MRYSSEVCWILPGSVPCKVLDWFDQDRRVSEAPPTTDYYVDLGSSATTSIKLCQGRMEFKAMRSPAPTTLKVSGVTGFQSQWAEWSCRYSPKDLFGSLARQSRWLTVWKSCSVRYYKFHAGDTLPAIAYSDADFKGEGCEVDLASLRILPVDTAIDRPSDERWEHAPQWRRFAIEAYGSRSRIVDYLREAALRQLTPPPPVRFAQHASEAYPEWLARQAGENCSIYRSAT